MIILLLGILTYASLVLETGGGSWSLPAATMPQFLFLAAAVAALRCRGAGAIVWAVVAGLLADVVHGSPLGLNVVLLANLTFLSRMIRTRPSARSVITSAAFVLLYVALAGLGSLALGDLLTARSPDVRLLLTSAVSRAGGTAAVYLIVVAMSALLARSVRWMIPRRTAATDRPRWAR